MANGPENRKEKRIRQYGTIMISDEPSQYFSYAKINNISGDGMCFESDRPFIPGSNIGIRYDNAPFKTAPKEYRATVLWCKPLTGENALLSYGVGVAYN